MEVYTDYDGDASVRYLQDGELMIGSNNPQVARWTGSEEQSLAEWHPQTFIKHIDPDTGYWYYENELTGERHWDRPLTGVLPLRPKSPGLEDRMADAARNKRQRSEQETRHQDMAKRRAYFDRQLLQEGDSAQTTEDQRVEALWDKADTHAALKAGDFSLAWQQVPAVSESHLFRFHERHGVRIETLRLVGLGLVEIPEVIGQHLWSLRSLSLSSNALQEIPDGLCNLTGLTELNLVRNKLVGLPDRFGNLLRLRSLSLAGNRLASIPPSFGNLLRLDRVVLDCNRLGRLPETLGRLKCRWFNVSNNKLGGLPHCIKDMPRLEVLSAVNNGLRSLPSDIGDSRSITALNLASNRLNQLPDSICRLKTLKTLWLDHNNIAGLPMQFHQLEGLETLMLEQNEMMYPPKEVVREGCDRIRVWCSRRMHDRLMARKHTIVMAVQDILKQINQRGLGDPSCFEADVQIGEKAEDHFYALVYDRFWDTMLPALERIGWMCERKATLIKHDIILEREQEERRRQELEQEDIEFRVNLARRLVKDNSETIEGKQTYTRKAVKMAEDLKKKQELGEYESGVDALRAQRRKVVEKKFTKIKQALAKDREHRLADLKLKVEAQKEELKALRGWGKEQKEAQIDQILKSMETLPEDKKLAEVDRQLEEEVAKVEEKASVVAAQKTRNVMTKKVKRRDKEFQDLVDEMMVDLVQQDMEAAGDEARRKAEEEHKIFRKIVAMWIGLGMRESFAEWKVWTKKRIRQRRKDARKALREAWHEYEAEGVVGVMAEWKASFWEEHYDKYNDSHHWTHKETGEVRTERPTVEEFIPEGYKIPVPPAKRLEDMSDSESDGSRSVGSSDSDTDARGGRRKGSAGGSSDSSTSSGWSFASSSDESQATGDSKESDEESEGSSSSPSDDALGVSQSEGSGDGRQARDSAMPAWCSKEFWKMVLERGDSEGKNSERSSKSASGSRSSSSASESGTSSDSHSGSGESDSGNDDTKASSTASPLLLSDGNEARSDDATSENTGDKGPLAIGEKTSIIATAKAETGGEVQPSEAAASSLTVFEGKRRSGADKHSTRQTLSTHTGLATFNKEKTVKAKEMAKRLIEASEEDSGSVASSLRTEKSLNRQKEWELNHARARARRLREQSVEEYQHELKIRREMAAIEARSLASNESPLPPLEEVMAMVGWSPDGSYTSKELEAFAKKAMKKMTELGKDGSAELIQYGNKSY